MSSHVFQATRILDRWRIALLRVTMKIEFLRVIYCDRALRLGVSFFAFCFLYLVISLQFSIVLLVFGPMILGYPHLIASYRFLQNPKLKLSETWKTSRVFRFFLFLTGASLAIRFLGTQTGQIPVLPYGTWEILLSLTTLGLLNWRSESRRSFVSVLGASVAVYAVLSYSWKQPLLFVGIALIFHNWVAFGHWIMSAKDKKNLGVAIFSSFLFALVHLVIFFGYLDSWISMSSLEFVSTKAFEAKGWALAPWSSDPLMWDRMVVLYTFGLSLHYFIWLRAIPQNLDYKSIPNSFRQSLIQLHIDCGPRTSTFLFLGAALLASVWLFTPFAGTLYFGIAMLHGWLEFVILVALISQRISTYAFFFLRKIHDSNLR